MHQNISFKNAYCISFIVNGLIKIVSECMTLKYFLLWAEEKIYVMCKGRMISKKNEIQNLGMWGLRTQDCIKLHLHFWIEIDIISDVLVDSNPTETEFELP